MENFDGLTTVNVELSSRCQKKCFMCGRRKLEKDFPELTDWGDMEFDLVKRIAFQLPSNIVTQFHWDGESMLYPRFGDAIKLFENQIKCMDTNGKLILKKADEIIGNLDTLTISVIENDLEGNEQYEIVKEFLSVKGSKKPLMVYRLLGNVDKPERWRELDGIVCTRILHSPIGSFNYARKVTIPEIGICLDLLNHLLIDRFGNVSCCVRFDPDGLGVIGDANKELLIDIWNGERRRKKIQHHLAGDRNKVSLCGRCHFWGVPTGI